MMWDDVQAKKLGITVRELRTERGLSQETLAHAAGITKNQLQLIEAGRSSGRKEDAGSSNPKMATLAGIADVLGMNLVDFFTAAKL